MHPAGDALLRREGLPGAQPYGKSLADAFGVLGFMPPQVGGRSQETWQVVGNMDIKEYSYILSVVKHGSISEAAKELFISQPSLSLYLKNLESRVGVKLFYKNGGRLFLTAEGKRYLEYAEQIVNLDSALMRELEGMRNLDTGSVILGVTWVRGSYLIPLIWPFFHERFPGIRLEFAEHSAKELKEMVRKHKIDMAIISELNLEASFESEILYHDQICVVIPKNLPLHDHTVLVPESGTKWIDFRLLTGQPFILLHQNQSMRWAADELFRQCHAQPNLLLEVSSADTAYKLSTEGVGCSIVTDSFCRKHASDQIRYYLTGAPPIENNVLVIYDRKDRLSSASRALLTVLQTLSYT